MVNIQFSHSSIGEINGRVSTSGVAQFRGLQYATLKDRFAPAVLKEYNQKDVVDGTKLGPQVPCQAPGPGMEAILLQQALDYDPSEYLISNLEGLNLNVTVPTSSHDQVQTKQKLPILAFIHGGGFNGGSSSFPSYDMTRLVKMSADNGMPIIAVTLNYRLNAPGFLTSRELRHAGYQPNNGLRDQRTALQWIQKHIGGFGGDPANVTLMGQSAGGVSISYHLHSKVPLFKRCVLMAGTYFAVPPITPERAETNYHDAIKILGLESAAPAERINVLLTMDSQELCAKLLPAGVSSLPVQDDEMINFFPTYENVSTGSLAVPGTKWCEAAIIGDCQFDGNIHGLYLMRRKQNIGAAFCKSITQSLGEKEGNKLLSAYNLAPEVPDPEAFFRVLQFANDITFFAPTLSLAAHLSSQESNMPMYMYRFNEPNPWEGQWKGHAVHVMDLAWLLQNFNEFLGEKQRQQAEDFAKAVLAFVSGKEPWKGWKQEEKIAKMIGPRGDVKMGKDEQPENGRNGVIFELAREIGMDVLSDALRAFMRGE